MGVRPPEAAVVIRLDDVDRSGSVDLDSPAEAHCEPEGFDEAVRLVGFEGMAGKVVELCV